MLVHTFNAKAVDIQRRLYCFEPTVFNRKKNVLACFNDRSWKMLIPPFFEKIYILVTIVLYLIKLNKVEEVQ